MAQSVQLTFWLSSSVRWMCAVQPDPLPMGPDLADDRVHEMAAVLIGP